MARVTPTDRTEMREWMVRNAEAFTFNGEINCTAMAEGFAAATHQMDMVDDPDGVIWEVAHEAANEVENG